MRSLQLQASLDARANVSPDSRRLWWRTRTWRVRRGGAWRDQPSLRKVQAFLQVQHLVFKPCDIVGQSADQVLSFTLGQKGLADGTASKEIPGASGDEGYGNRGSSAATPCQAAA